MEREYNETDSNLPRKVLEKLFDAHELIEQVSSYLHEDTQSEVLYPLERLLTANGFNFQEQDL